MYYIYHENKIRKEQKRKTHTPNKRKLCKTRFRNTVRKISQGSHFRCRRPKFFFRRSCCRRRSCRLFVCFDKMSKTWIQYSTVVVRRFQMIFIIIRIFRSLAWDLYWFVVPLIPRPKLIRNYIYTQKKAAEKFSLIFIETHWHVGVVKINDRIRRCSKITGGTQIQQWIPFA